MLTEGAQLFSFDVKNIAYAYQVFPAILSVLLYTQVEKWFTRISPKPIRIFFVPMMSLVITVPITLVVCRIRFVMDKRRTHRIALADKVDPDMLSEARPM